MQVADPLNYQKTSKVSQMITTASDRIWIIINRCSATISRPVPIATYITIKMYVHFELYIIPAATKSQYTQ